MRECISGLDIRKTVDARLCSGGPRRKSVVIAVQPGLKKYSATRFAQINSRSLAVPFSQEGRFAVVTNVGRGMQWTRERA
jgi:hypothetical protein